MLRRGRGLSTVILNRPGLSLVILALLLVGGVLFAFIQARGSALEQETSLLDLSAESITRNVEIDIGRSLAIPEVLQHSSMVRALLIQPDAATLAAENDILEQTARDVHVDVIYVLDTHGVAIAASNWRAPDSFVGHGYAFRPYFTQAMAGDTGRYLAMGIVSHKLGYYLSRPVTVDGVVRGVVVVKISLDAIQANLQRAMQRDGEVALLTDAHGVVIASPVNALMLKAMAPLADITRADIESSRQYGGPVSMAAVTPGEMLDAEIRTVEFTDLPGHTYLQKASSLPGLGMRLYLQVPDSRYWDFVAEFTGMFSLVALVIFLLSVSIYQRWAYHMQLVSAAIRDPLTGLYTRLYMNDWCQAALRTHERDPGAGLALLVFDLDLFKQVNDRFGHLAGDEVLKRVGAIIRGALRGEDLAVRFGGEELAVFVRCNDIAVALGLAERIRHTVQDTEFLHGATRIPVTLSGGIALHATGEGLDALFARADQRLYEAKAGGRNRICV